MLSFLNSPFPSMYGEKRNFYVAILVGIFVGSFLWFFQPFGYAKVSMPYLQLRILGFGIVTFLGLLFVYFVLPRLFPKFFEEKNYTVGKELIIAVVIILVIGIGNWGYQNIVIEEMSYLGSIRMIWNTFIIGIFPLSVLTLLQYNTLLKKYLKESSELKLEASSSESEPIAVCAATAAAVPNLMIKAENESAEIELSKLLYIESVGNYANVVQFSDEKLSRNLFRATLKSIEAENKLSNVLRCHRSYIVNLDHVIDVNGNAQGFKLTLNNCDELIPVSRKYVPEIKAYFA